MYISVSRIVSENGSFIGTSFQASGLQPEAGHQSPRQHCWSHVHRQWRPGWCELIIGILRSYIFRICYSFVVFFLPCVLRQQRVAQEVLTTLKEHPDAWTRVDAILEFSSNQQTKYYALQILEQVIKTRWRALPRNQCEGEYCFKERADIDFFVITLLSQLIVLLYLIQA